ncbi:MAG: hypothetical protein QOJ89_125 [bacterium]|jgi:RimJ/RimL family protein N-acetyltransferase
MRQLPFPDPPLADELIRLRPWTRADAGAAFSATQDPLIAHHTHVPERQTLDDVRRFIDDREPRRLAGDELGFVIAARDDDAFLGCVSLLRFDWPDRRGEIGYYLAEWGRGRGVMTRAARLLSRWALQDLGLARLELIADVDNAPSQAVAERCGFTREGVLRSYEERKGRRVDVVLFSLLPQDLG